MIRGQVNDRREAVIELDVIGTSAKRRLGLVIDTGFNGCLSLEASVIRELGLENAGQVEGKLADGRFVDFDSYFATLMWNGMDREIAVIASAGGNFVGTELLEDSRLTVDVVTQGAVTIQAISEVEPLT